MESEEDLCSSALPHSSVLSETEEEEFHQQQQPNRKPRRALCLDGCGRPKTVCLCPYFPIPPLLTSTRVVVLQHPHELRHPLSTSPLLPRCLLNCTTIPGRRLHPGLSPLLDSPDSNILFLFPSSDPSAAISRYAAEDNGNGKHEESGKERVLVVFDATWKHAREMAAASIEFFEARGARRVSLGRFDPNSGMEEEGDSMSESELVLRKQPVNGCMSTMEAVARALRAIEPDGSVAVEVESVLVELLKAMVRFQAQHLRSAVKRTKLKKTKKKLLLGR